MSKRKGFLCLLMVVMGASVFALYNRQGIPDSSEIRQKLVESWFTAPVETVRGKVPELHRNNVGTVFQIPWAYLGEEHADWPEKGMTRLKDMGFKTAAMALREDTLSIRDERLAQEPKLALVLGTEGDGLADGTITNCDYTVKIPMTHGVDSLNVAAASAVAFWQLRKR